MVLYLRRALVRTISPSLNASAIDISLVLRALRVDTEEREKGKLCVLECLVH